MKVSHVNFSITTFTKWQTAGCQVGQGIHLWRIEFNGSHLSFGHRWWLAIAHNSWRSLHQPFPWAQKDMIIDVRLYKVTAALLHAVASRAHSWPLPWRCGRGCGRSVLWLLWWFASLLARFRWWRLIFHRFVLVLLPTPGDITFLHQDITTTLLRQ